MTGCLGQGRKCVLEHCGCIKIERALFVSLLFDGEMINPDSGEPEVQDRQQTIGSRDPVEIGDKPLQPDCRF